MWLVLFFGLLPLYKTYEAWVQLQGRRTHTRHAPMWRLHVTWGGRHHWPRVCAVLFFCFCFLFYLFYFFMDSRWFGADSHQTRSIRIETGWNKARIGWYHLFQLEKSYWAGIKLPSSFSLSSAFHLLFCFCVLQIFWA